MIEHHLTVVLDFFVDCAKGEHECLRLHFTLSLHFLVLFILCSYLDLLEILFDHNHVLFEVLAYLFTLFAPSLYRTNLLNKIGKLYLNIPLVVDVDLKTNELNWV